MQQILPPLDRLDPLVGATQSPRSAWALASRLHGRFEKLRAALPIALHFLEPLQLASSSLEKTDLEDYMYTHSESKLNLSRTTFLSILHRDLV